MPLDRRITLRIRGPEVLDEYHTLQPGPFADHVIWASRHDVGTERWIVDEGQRVTQETVYRVRYRSDLDARDVAGDRINIVDDGTHYTITDLAEVSDPEFQRTIRRRFIDLRAVRKDPQPSS